MTEPVRLYVDDDARLPATVGNLLKAEREQLLEALVNAMDWGDYQQRVGVLRGIDRALEICEQAAGELRGR